MYTSSCSRTGLNIKVGIISHFTPVDHTGSVWEQYLFLLHCLVTRNLLKTSLQKGTISWHLHWNQLKQLAFALQLYKIKRYIKCRLYKCRSWLLIQKKIFTLSVLLIFYYLIWHGDHVWLAVSKMWYRQLCPKLT